MFRFNLAPVNRRSSPASAPSSAAGAPIKILALCGAVLLGLALLTGWLLGSRSARPGELEPDAGPVLIAMRRIGQMHSVSMQMKDVFRQESQGEPSGLAKELPGAAGVVHWATHNQALVVAEGTVEAGIDLSQISEKDVSKVKGADGKTVLRVHLPPVVVYPPNVHLRVEDSSSGLLWHDQNIVPKAQEQASRRFLEAAEQQNIRATARDNAIQTLQKLQQELGNANIEFTFG